MELTTKERAVVEAMRLGADLEIRFHTLNELEEVDERLEFFSDFKANGNSWITELQRHGRDEKFLSFRKSMKKLEVYCFLDIKKDQPGSHS